LDNANQNQLSCYIGSTLRPGVCRAGTNHSFALLIRPLQAEFLVLSVIVSANNGTTTTSHVFKPVTTVQVCFAHMCVAVLQGGAHLLMQLQCCRGMLEQFPNAFEFASRRYKIM
jgi:hypothetical protein